MEELRGNPLDLQKNGFMVSLSCGKINDTAVMFGHYGKAFYEVVKFLGLDVKKIGYNQPAGVRYPTENPWG